MTREGVIAAAGVPVSDLPPSPISAHAGRGSVNVTGSEKSGDAVTLGGDRHAVGLVVRLVGSGIEAPLVAGPAEWKRIVGDPRSLHSIWFDCETGRLPTLPRVGGSGSHHRIAVAKALDELGVAYDIVPASA
jgi:hypothetical protein